MRSAARASEPDECCGLLLGHEAIEDAVPTRNVAAEPRRRFEIEPQALINAHRAARGGGTPLRGYYHSHPTGPAEPSATDRAMAAGDGKVWAIVGADGITFWRDDEAGFARLFPAATDS